MHLFAANDARVFWSPGNTCADETGAVRVSQNGSYFKTGFTGTSLRLSVDTGLYRANAISASNWARWIVSVDGGAPRRVAVPAMPGSASVASLAENLDAGAHQVIAWYELHDESDTYTPRSAQTVRQILLDPGEDLAPPSGFAAIRPYRALILGDSITKGYDTRDLNDNFPGNYPLSTYATLLGIGLNAEIGIVGFSGQGWTRSSNAWSGVFSNTFPNIDSRHPRLFAGFDYLIASHGTNDGVSDVTNAAAEWITGARDLAGPRTWIVLIVPFDGSHETEIRAAVSNYRESRPADERVVAVSPQSVVHSVPGRLFAVDAAHPNTLAMSWWAAALTGQIVAATRDKE